MGASDKGFEDRVLETSAGVIFLEIWEDNLVAIKRDHPNDPPESQVEFLDEDVVNNLDEFVSLLRNAGVPEAESRVLAQPLLTERTNRQKADESKRRANRATRRRRLLTSLSSRLVDVVKLRK